MKRVFAAIFLALVIGSLLAALAWCGYCLWDYRQIQADNSLSGIDFLMTGTVYGIGLAAICIFGAVVALVHFRLTERKRLQIFDCVAAFILLLGILAAFLLIFI